MTHLLLIPSGPRSAPYRILVDLVGVRIFAVRPERPEYIEPTTFSWGQLVSDSRPTSSWPEELFRNYDTTLANAQAAWDKNRQDECARAMSRHAEIIDEGYRHTCLMWGSGENEETWYSHATMDEIIAAIREADATDETIAIAVHKYDTAGS